MQRQIVSKLFFLILYLGSCIIAQAAYAADGPVVLFSDLTDGPVSGWEGSSTKGAAVSIWGRNFGANRGSSYVTVGGINLTNDSDYAEWGAANNPITARGLQRITFWLNSGMAAGPAAISVTTADGTSQPVAFFTRTNGTIYFVTTSGSDSNTGLSVASAWRNPSKARGTLQTGDVAYFKSGVYNLYDDWECVVDFWSNNHNNGAANNCIALVSYPGEAAQLGDNTNTYVIRHHGSDGDILNYWTFSKFIMRANGNVTNWGLAAPGSDDHNRFIGNDMSTTAGGKTILPFDGQIGGQTNLSVFGNYIADAGVDNRGEIAPSKGYAIYMSGYGWHDYIDIGWNELAYNTMGRGLQVYGHTVTDSIDHIYIHDNYMHDNAFNGAVLGGGDGAGGSYEYTFVHNLYFYNNVISNNGLDNTTTWAGILLGGVSWGTVGADYYIYNNTFYNNPAGAFAFDGKPNSVTLKNNIDYRQERSYSTPDFDNDLIPVVDGNLYYGGTGIPSWEFNYILADPKFADALNGDFSLLLNSGARDAGKVIEFVSKDYNGVNRPQGAGYDIGAIEYTGGDITSSGLPPQNPTGFTVK